MLKIISLQSLRSLAISLAACRSMSAFPVNAAASSSKHFIQFFLRRLDLLPCAGVQLSRYLRYPRRGDIFVHGGIQDFGTFEKPGMYRHSGKSSSQSKLKWMFMICSSMFWKHVSGHGHTLLAFNGVIFTPFSYSFQSFPTLLCQYTY